MYLAHPHPLSLSLPFLADAMLMFFTLSIPNNNSTPQHLQSPFIYLETLSPPLPYTRLTYITLHSWFKGNTHSQPHILCTNSQLYFCRHSPQSSPSIRHFFRHFTIISQTSLLVTTTTTISSLQSIFHKYMFSHLSLLSYISSKTCK